MNRSLFSQLFFIAFGVVFMIAFPSADGFVLASQIGTLVTGAGVVTTIPGQSVCDQFLYLGDFDTAMPLTGLSVEVDGNPTINIQGSQPLMSAWAKYMSQFSATVVGVLPKLSLGKINKTTTYRLTNAGATTPAIFAYSENVAPMEAPNGGAFFAASKGINALSQETFRDFTALFITPSANMGTADVTFKNGNKSTMAITDLDAMFARKNPSEANGRLDAVVTTVDNRDPDTFIDQIVINATTALTVLVLKLNNDDIKALRAA